MRGLLDDTPIKGDLLRVAALPPQQKRAAQASGGRDETYHRSIQYRPAHEEHHFKKARLEFCKKVRNSAEENRLGGRRYKNPTRWLSKAMLMLMTQQEA